MKENDTKGKCPKFLIAAVASVVASVAVGPAQPHWNFVSMWYSRIRLNYLWRTNQRVRTPQTLCERPHAFGRWHISLHIYISRADRVFIFECAKNESLKNRRNLLFVVALAARRVLGFFSGVSMTNHSQTHQSEPQSGPRERWELNGSHVQYLRKKALLRNSRTVTRLACRYYLSKRASGKETITFEHAATSALSDNPAVDLVGIASNTTPCFACLDFLSEMSRIARAPAVLKKGDETRQRKLWTITVLSKGTVRYFLPRDPLPPPPLSPPMSPPPPLPHAPAPCWCL